MSIEKDIMMIKENALSAISAMFTAAQKESIPYWQKVAELIFALIKNAKT